MWTNLDCIKRLAKNALLNNILFHIHISSRKQNVDGLSYKEKSKIKLHVFRARKFAEWLIGLAKSLIELDIAGKKKKKS